MARFRGLVQGSREPVTRLGGAKTGLRVEANGWRLGVRVTAYVNADGKDTFRIERTGGSQGRYRKEEIAIVTEADPR